jgi:hypothetical protein
MSMRPNYDDPIPRQYGLQIGVVVDRDDPEKLGRVRVRIPGLIDPASNWAYPLGSSGGGSSDVGFFNIPPIGAEVGIFFKQGHTDHPYYMSANWGIGEIPQNSEDGDPDIKVVAFKDYDIVINEKTGQKGFKILDKAINDNIIEFNGITQTLSIKAVTSIAIEAIGEITLDALTVIINGIVAGNGQL